MSLKNARQRSDRYGRQNNRSNLTPRRSEVIERLEKEHLLPAIYFLFSRAGCEDAVEQILRSGLHLTDPAERNSIRAQVLELTRDLPDDDLIALGFTAWLDGLERGVAAHHAGLLPRFKEIVESLFQQGLLKVVFATETLALGINMPARSVVLERLVKWNGEAHVDLSPGEYTQLTGRAGRRGIDIEGHAVVLWQNDMDPKTLAGLASTRTYPLKSSFRPSYNMAVNLVGTIGVARARELLETSFAQFQADRSVVGLANELRKLEEARDGYRDAMQCHLGDFDEYARIRNQIGREEKSDSRAAVVHRRASGEAQLRALKQGDVVVLSSGKKSGPAVVISAATPQHGEEPRPLVLTSDRQIRRLNHHDGLHDLTPIGRVRIPKHFTSKDQKLRKSIAAQVRNIAAEKTDTQRRLTKSQRLNPVVQDMRDQLKSHPCHGCADREAHARWGERYYKVQSQISEVHGRMQGRTNTISKRFDRLCEVLGKLDYLQFDEEKKWRVTESGGLLKGIYSEADLLVAQCIRLGVLDQLDAPALAAVCSSFLYESRGSEYEDSPSVPGGPTERALDQINQVWGELTGVENDHRLQGMRRIDAGLAWAIYRWAMPGR
jgi:ATP-dependent RNA helicase HelY